MLQIVINRDSCIYFACLFLTNFVSLAMLWHTWRYVEPVSTWIAVITATLTSHFMLDLRKVARREPDGHDSDNTLMDDMSFTGTARSTIDVFSSLSHVQSRAVDELPIS